MTDDIDDAVSRWIGTVMQGAHVSLALSQEERPDEGVGLLLLEMFKSVPISTARPVPLKLTLRYLITAWAKTPEKAHGTVAQLLFAAMENPDFEVESHPPPLELWRTIGMPPQPAFFLRKPYVKERPAPPAVYVTGPVSIEFVARSEFFGKVLGPRDMAISNCSVEVPAVGVATRTDQQGEFRFANLPRAGNIQLVLRARGREMSISSEQRSADRRSPTILRFTSLEG